MHWVLPMLLPHPQPLSMPGEIVFNDWVFTNYVIPSEFEFAATFTEPGRDVSSSRTEHLPILLPHLLTLEDLIHIPAEIASSSPEYFAKSLPHPGWPSDGLHHLGFLFMSPPGMTTESIVPLHL